MIAIREEQEVGCSMPRQAYLAISPIELPADTAEKLKAGGRVKSPAKAKSSRENGKLGGMPKKKVGVKKGAAKKALTKKAAAKKAAAKKEGSRRSVADAAVPAG